MTHHTGHYTLTYREMTGRVIKNSDQEELGKIKDVLLDTVNGTITRVILTSGGFLGLGEKQFAVPWDMIHYETETDTLTMNIEKDFLQHIPTYEGEETRMIS